ncbi:low molecular weight phosphatase family protein [Formosa sp. A9]|uniref:arsenate-mycothiol transferase ArsC n=1 Tax=Formosa sp. A9 TaxID=3442641 RepID=UPI003EC0EAC3
MYTKLSNLIASFNYQSISEDRKTTLQPLVDYIQEKFTKKETIRLNFICTHNSRRSHLSQVWAQTAALYFKIPSVVCFSGGTEATALFPKVAETLEATGFKIQQLSQEQNPVYAIKYAENEHPVIGFSKRFDADFNPEAHFAAIMTCSQADQGCPFIAGAEKRIPITFEDPKAFDGTPQQTEQYNARSLQIAEELCYVFSKIN